MGDESQPQWGSYPKYEAKQPIRKTQEQVDASDATFAYLQARNERFWPRERDLNPLWRFAMISALMARYEVMGEVHWQLVDERRAQIKQAFKDACVGCDPKALARDYNVRWLTAYHWGQDGLNRLDDAAKSVESQLSELSLD